MAESDDDPDAEHGLVAEPMSSRDGGTTFVVPCPPGERYTDPSVYPPPELPLDFLHVDDQIVVVVKPAFLPSKNGRHLSDSVLSRVAAELALRSEPTAGLQLAHRLDWETSGVLVLARTTAAMRSLSTQFESRSVKKVYIADITGARGPRRVKGCISLPMSQDPDRRPLQRIDFGATGRSCCTHYTVIASCAGAWRVRLEPLSGRTHQLRVHMLAAFGCAIVGDALYGQFSDQAEAPLRYTALVRLDCLATSGEAVRVRCTPSAHVRPIRGGCTSARLHLHAAELSFTHPGTGAHVTFRSEPTFQMPSLHPRGA
jgi:tRNA pseudouridine32 synthase/23S rRNA pseudouridine746 synthase